MRSTDPEFETKAADVIGLYLDPPQHAVVFCIDEKTAIQALDRLDPVLPLSPGRAERHGFEYYRHGTLSLYAALNTRTGEVVGRTAGRHTSAEFVRFLQAVVDTQPRRREMHIIVDNLSAHKTQLVRTFMVAHPHVHLHYTPTYSSWLNQVELWFSKIERDVTARGLRTWSAHARILEASWPKTAIRVAVVSSLRPARRQRLSARLAANVIAKRTIGSVPLSDLAPAFSVGPCESVCYDCL